MNKNNIKTIGKKQTSREDSLLFMVSEVEGLMETLDKDFLEWSDFDYWKNMAMQQWIFFLYFGLELELLIFLEDNNDDDDFDGGI